MSGGWLGWAPWLEQTAPAIWVRTSTWGYPAVEVVHLFGLALLIGTAVAFDLRLLGLSPRLPVDGMARHLLPWARVGFTLALFSGLLLFSTQAATFIRQPIFLIKVAAIAVGVGNAAVFARGAHRDVLVWNYSARPPGAARGAALVSLGAWTTALVCGRLLAYL
jgi:hypothetical protein